MDLGVTKPRRRPFWDRGDVPRGRANRPYNHDASKWRPRGECRAADIGDVPLPPRASASMRLDRGPSGVSTSHPKAGVRPLSVGGESARSNPILQGLGQDRPVGSVHIDAHMRIIRSGRNDDGSKVPPTAGRSAGGARAVLDPERTIQIGIRGPAEASGFSPTNPG